MTRCNDKSINWYRSAMTSCVKYKNSSYSNTSKTNGNSSNDNNKECQFSLTHY